MENCQLAPNNQYRKADLLKIFYKEKLSDEELPFKNCQQHAKHNDKLLYKKPLHKERKKLKSLL